MPAEDKKGTDSCVGKRHGRLPSIKYRRSLDSAVLLERLLDYRLLAAWWQTSDAYASCFQIRSSALAAIGLPRRKARQKSAVVKRLFCERLLTWLSR